MQAGPTLAFSDKTGVFVRTKAEKGRKYGSSGNLFGGPNTWGR